MIDELLKLLALIITPDWGALIVLLPLFIAPLVLLWFFATGGGWGLVALTKRRAQLKYADATPTEPSCCAGGGWGDGVPGDSIAEVSRGDRGCAESTCAIA